MTSGFPATRDIFLEKRLGSVLICLPNGKLSRLNLMKHLLLSVLMGVGVCSQTFAMPLITSPGIGEWSFQQESATVGNSFQVGSSSLTIVSLGLLDDGSAGFLQSHSEGLWTEGGVLLAQVD